MLRKLSIENYYSVKDRQTLDLAIARNATDPDGRFADLSSNSGLRVPRVAAIFGANASGKSTILRAIAFLKHFVQDSANFPPGQELPFLAFGGGDVGSVTRLEIEIESQVEVSSEVIPRSGPAVFRYEVDLASDRSRVLRESLSYLPFGRPRKLFERTDDKVVAGRDFGLPARHPIHSSVRPNASVISLLARFGHPFSDAIFTGLASVTANVPLVGEGSPDPSEATKYYLRAPEVLSKLNREIEKIDLGISGVTLDRTNQGVEPMFSHAGFPQPLPLAFESHGTQRFYAVFPVINHALETGGLAVLDEFDNDIHPFLLSELVRWFQDPRTNPRNAQLIMSCHDATLLQHLAKEEVYFTEKDGEGRTTIYGLKDIKAVRRDTNIYAKYLAGAFGAVPRVA